MAVGSGTLPELHPVAGVRIGSTEAGIRYTGRRDLVVMEFAPGSTCAGTFTRNAFCAAPVTVAREHMGQKAPRYFIINTGNANAGTGDQGMLDARTTCAELAHQVGCDEREVLPFSTGVIGENLPMDRLLAGIPGALAALSLDGWRDAAHGILTTDTRPKGSSRRIETAAGTVTLTGIAKGSGMIRPDMATMLAYIATDAVIPSDRLQRYLSQAVDQSFNSITVDGDTSTNDACMLVATGASGVAIEAGGGQEEAFLQALNEVCVELAQAIVRDGEGATKFIHIQVEAGRDRDECRQVAYTIAHSPLVKTAFFASDPNWGRILAAVGRAGLADLDLNAVTIHLDDVCIVSGGGRDPGYTEEAGQAVMDREEITVRVHLGRGEAAVTIWTTDLSHEYVRINAEYRS